jgi:hypothetical protein
MTYQFAGFMAAARLPKPERLPQRSVWKDIRKPFIGVGLFLPEFIDKQPEPRLITQLASEYGFSASPSWIYLTYTCWGGSVDFVYGLGARNGHSFGPDASDDFAESTYVELMKSFGLSESSASNFEPFYRGFWNET